jgi:outer membrane receptor for ferrienterochelin and colicins
MKVVPLVLLLVLSVALQVAADTTDTEPGEDTETVELPAVTITATRLPKALKDAPVQTQLIQKEEIRESGAASLEDVLSTFGLSYTSNAMGSFVTLQGMSGERVLFLVDGRRLIGRVAGNVDAANIPVESIERIEVVRGPQSALYGSDAIGGVINIITKKPEPRVSVDFDLRNTGLPVADSTDPPARSYMRQQELDVSVSVPTGPLLSRISVFGSRAFAYRDEFNIGLYPETLNAGGTLTTVMEITPTSSVTLGGGYSSARRDDYISASGSYDRVDTTRSDAHARYDLETPEAARFSTGLSYQYFGRERNQYNSLLEEFHERGDEREDYVLGEASYAWFVTDRNELSLFASVAYNRLERYNIQDGDANDRWSGALVIQNEYFSPDAFSVAGGLRSEYSSDYGAFFSPKVSGMVYLTDNLRLLPAVGIGYRAPSFLELYLDSPGNVYHKFGNPDLEPEKSVGASVGLEWFGAFFLFQTTAYHNELFDEIVYDYTETYTDPGGLHIIIKENLNRSSRTGADLSAETRGNQYVAVGGRYSYLYAWDREQESRIETQPDHRAGHWLRLSAGRAGPSLRIDGSWASSYSRRQDPLYTVDLRANVPVQKNVAVYAGAKNITGQEDPYGHLYTGPEYYLGVSGSF